MNHEDLQEIELLKKKKFIRKENSEMLELKDKPFGLSWSSYKQISCLITMCSILERKKKNFYSNPNVKHDEF